MTYNFFFFSFFMLVETERKKVAHNACNKNVCDVARFLVVTLAVFRVIKVFLEFQSFHLSEIPRVILRFVLIFPKVLIV